MRGATWLEVDAASLKKFDFIFQHLCQSGGGWQNDILYVTSFHLYEPGSYLALKETKKTPTTLLTSMIRTVITHFEGFVFLNYLNCYNLVIILAISLSSHTEIWHVEKQLVFLKGKLQWALVPAPSGNSRKTSLVLIGQESQSQVRSLWVEEGRYDILQPHGRGKGNEVQELEHIPCSYLNDLVCPRGQQPSPGGIEVYVNNVVLTVMESSCRCSPEERNPKSARTVTAGFLPKMFSIGEKIFDCCCKPLIQQSLFKQHFEIFLAWKEQGQGALYPFWLGLLLILLRKPRDHRVCEAAPSWSLAAPQALPAAGAPPAAVQCSSVPTLTPRPWWTRGSCRRPSLRTRSPSGGWRSAWSCTSRTRLSRTSGSDAARHNRHKDF